MNANTSKGRVQSARKPRHKNWPSAADFSEGRVAHDFVGPDRFNVHVHCKNCGLIFKILEARGPCYGNAAKLAEKDHPNG